MAAPKLAKRGAWMYLILGDLLMPFGDRNETYFWIEFVNPADSLFDSTILNSLANLHAFLNHGVVNVVRKAGLASEFDGGF